MDVPNRHQPRPETELKHPDWSKDATIYQINQRHFTPEGTFRAAKAHLPRLRDLGVDILWLMPVNPIGQEHRKGVLGSQYAVQDYLAVNPEFGDLDDLRHFVAAAHEHGLRVILDWVANHTAWDNVLVTQHPQWYARDWKGDFRPTPWWDWDDVIDLDYSCAELREYMTEAMKYWVREADVDGYRCDVAGFVPVDFWENARRELDEIKPVFLLAEWEARDLHARALEHPPHAGGGRPGRGEPDGGGPFRGDLPVPLGPPRGAIRARQHELPGQSRPRHPYRPRDPDRGGPPEVGGRRPDLAGHRGVGRHRAHPHLPVDLPRRRDQRTLALGDDAARTRGPGSPAAGAGLSGPFQPCIPKTACPRPAPAVMIPGS